MMGTNDEITLDFKRGERIGLEEAIYAESKSSAQIETILETALARDARLLLTRLDVDKLNVLPQYLKDRIDYCAVSRTAYFGPPHSLGSIPHVALVVAGTSDMPVAREAERTLNYYGYASSLFADVGVAGLWRLTSRIEAIRAHPIVIVAAGMDAALPSVVAGLVPGAVIAVPTSVGYGVAAGGRAALDAILASCVSGITVVNIDNGYGAACAALRVRHAAELAAIIERPNETAAPRLNTVMKS